MKQYDIEYENGELEVDVDVTDDGIPDVSVAVNVKAILMKYLKYEVAILILGGLAYMKAYGLI